MDVSAAPPGILVLLERNKEIFNKSDKKCAMVSGEPETSEPRQVTLQDLDVLKALL